MTEPSGGGQITSMIFRRHDTDEFLWATPGVGPWQPIPRIGEQVRYGYSPDLWRVADVSHDWGDDVRLPGSCCFIVAVYLKPDTEEKGNAA
jgi:hypothetical protein